MYFDTLCGSKKGVMNALFETRYQKREVIKKMENVTLVVLEEAIELTVDGPMGCCALSMSDLI